MMARFYFHFFTLFMLFSWDSSAQRQWSPEGGAYEGPQKKGYVEGKVYKNDGTILEGLVYFPYTSKMTINFAEKPGGEEYIQLTPQEVFAFTLEEDSFITAKNVIPQIRFNAVKTFYDLAFVEVLVNGPVSLFKLQDYQTNSNMRIIRVETFLVGREEEDFSVLITIPSVEPDFTYYVEEYFRRDKALMKDFVDNDYFFLDLGLMVETYNKRYSVTEKEPENSNVTIYRRKNKERAEPVNIIINDTIKTSLGISDLYHHKAKVRINKICIEDGECLAIRADEELPQFIEIRYREKYDQPRMWFIDATQGYQRSKGLKKKKNK